jgi:hypothetical protein
LGYLQPSDLAEANKRIDEAATAAGRDPRSIRRIINAGFQPADVLIAFTLDFGMDTYLISDDPAAMRKFASEVAPRVREQVASQRLSRAH